MPELIEPFFKRPVAVGTIDYTCKECYESVVKLAEQKKIDGKSLDWLKSLAGWGV